MGMLRLRVVATFRAAARGHTEYAAQSDRRRVRSAQMHPASASQSGSRHPLMRSIDQVLAKSRSTDIALSDLVVSRVLPS